MVDSAGAMSGGNLGLSLTDKYDVSSEESLDEKDLSPQQQVEYLQRSLKAGLGRGTGSGKLGKFPKILEEFSRTRLAVSLRYLDIGGVNNQIKMDEKNAKEKMLQEDDKGIQSKNFLKNFSLSHGGSWGGGLGSQSNYTAIGLPKRTNADGSPLKEGHNAFSGGVGLGSTNQGFGPQSPGSPGGGIRGTRPGSAGSGKGSPHSPRSPTSGNKLPPIGGSGTSVKDKHAFAPGGYKKKNKDEDEEKEEDNANHPPGSQQHGLSAATTHQFLSVSNSVSTRVGLHFSPHLATFVIEPESHSLRCITVGEIDHPPGADLMQICENDWAGEIQALNQSRESIGFALISGRIIYHFTFKKMFSREGTCWFISRAFLQ